MPRFLSRSKQVAHLHKMISNLINYYKQLELNKNELKSDCKPNKKNTQKYMVQSFGKLTSMGESIRTSFYWWFKERITKIYKENKNNISISWFTLYNSLEHSLKHDKKLVYKNL